MVARTSILLALLVFALSISDAASAALPPHQPRLPQMSAATLERATSGLRNYTLFLQCNSTWGSSDTDTICSAGCAMTSLAMVLNTIGTNTSATMNPGSLNSWLSGHNGYTDHDLLLWAAADSLGPVQFSQYFNGTGSLPLVQMQQLVSSGYPIIVNVLGGTHWVLAVAFTGSNFAVNDPAAFHTSYQYFGMSKFVVYNV